MLSFKVHIIFSIASIVVMLKHLAMTQIITYMSTQYKRCLVMALDISSYPWQEEGSNAILGLDGSKTIWTGISSLPHYLKLAMPPIFLLFVVPHQQEQVHPDKSPACDVVGVQPNLGYVPCTLMIHRLVCLCAGSAGACVQLLQLASLHEEKDVAGSGLSMFPGW